MVLLSRVLDACNHLINDLKVRVREDPQNIGLKKKLAYMITKKNYII